MLLSPTTSAHWSQRHIPKRADVARQIARRIASRSGKLSSWSYNNSPQTSSHAPSTSLVTNIAMSLSNSETFIEHSSADEVNSLPSSSTSSSVDEEEYMSDADREWKESLQQLELLLTMVMVPYLGKYFGRKAAYWGWAKFMEWKYPVEITISNPKAFKLTGAVEAAATL